MLIDVDRIPKEGLRISEDFDYMSQDLVEESAIFLKPAHADLSVKRVGEEIWIKGRLTTALSCLCSRCLSPFEFPVDILFDLVYFPEDMDVLNEELEEENMEKVYFYSHQIDLKEVVLEQLNLSFPVKPLCSQDCEGICPICGQVKESDHCGCSVGRADPRFEKLKSLVREKK